MIKTNKKMENSVKGFSGAASESEIASKLMKDPSCRHTLRTLGNLLESEHDTVSAKNCYLGRIPVHVQQRLFGIECMGNLQDNSAAQYINAHPSETIHPHSISVYNTECLKPYIENTLKSNPTYVAVYRNSSLWHDGFNTAVFNNDNIIDRSTFVGNLGPVNSASSIRCCAKIHGKAVLMGSRGSNNYYHWMADILPKMAILEKSEVELNNETKYIFTNVSKKFQIETLKKIGLKDHQIYSTRSEGEYIQADELLIPVLKNQMGHSMGRWFPNFMKRIYKADDVRVGKRKKILISRNSESSRGRCISNADEFNTYFLNKGYELVSPEQHSVAEQAQIFAQATHVVGPHGAGFTNLLFCREGTQVYEFYGQHLAPCYWALSELSKLEYVNLCCTRNITEMQSELSVAKSLINRRSTDFRIPLTKIDRKYV